MPIKLERMDWSRPALAQAVQWLFDRFSSVGELNLADVIVTVPGNQVARRLLELLVAESSDRGYRLTPPRILTAGELPEELYERKKPFAGSLAQELAWAKVLQVAEPKRLNVLLRTPPAEDDLSGWLALGQMLAQLHRELAAEGHDCGDIAKHAKQLDGFNELERWKLLADLEQQYLRLLDSLELWDKQTARLFAIEHRECRTEKQIVLVGMVDLNRSQRQMLDQVADRVTALDVWSGEFSRHLFDEHGCLAPDAWQEIAPNLPLERIEIAGGPADQADAVIRAMAGWRGRYAAEEITIGVPDARLVPYLRQRLEEAELPARFGPGTPLSRTSVVQLLAEVAEYIEGRKFRDLAALVRHPDVTRWLLSRSEIDGDWLTAFDQFFGNRFPDVPQPKEFASKNSKPIVRHAQGAIHGLISDLHLDAERSLNEWSQPILDLLRLVYDRPLDEQIESDRMILLASDKIAKVLTEHEELKPALAPRVTGAQALRLLLAALEGDAIPPHAGHGAIELLGWLDLPWDDAPALIVTGMNDGIVPGSVGSDVFLPDALRRTMELEKNSLRRYARDCYTLCLLTASRPGLRVIAGRRSAEGDALIPSRLLLACDEHRELPGAAQDIAGRAGATGARVVGRQPASGADGPIALAAPVGRAARRAGRVAAGDGVPRFYCVSLSATICGRRLEAPNARRFGRGTRWRRLRHAAARRAEQLRPGRLSRRRRSRRDSP